MDSEGILESLSLRKSHVQTNYITDAVKRQADGGSAIDTTTLPIGAIIVIAIIGSALLFGVLTTIVMEVLRSRYKRKKRPRDLDLSDDNDEDIRDALRSTRPPDIGLEARIQHKPPYAATGSRATAWPEPRFYGPQLDNPVSMPPAYAFEITGLRDSWPMVGWVQSHPNMPQYINKHPTINSANVENRTSYSAFLYSADNEPAWPQPTFSRPGSITVRTDRRSNRWSNHSAKSSVTSLERLLANRKSVSDGQLTSILRSTSQRLKAARRRPISRTMNFLSEVSDISPAAQPPSPSRDQNGDGPVVLVDNDYVSLVDSVPSSILNRASQTPDPQKMILRTAESVQEIEKRTSPMASELSEVDSLCSSKIPDSYIPAALSSPSKRGVEVGQGHEMSISSTVDPLTGIDQDEGWPLVALADDSGNANPSLSNSLSSANDPFLSVDTTTKRRLNSKSPKGPRPLTKRNTAIQQNSKTDGWEVPFPRLRPMSGNLKSPNQLNLGPVVSATETQESSFYWSAHFSKSLALYSNQKPTGTRQKGHKRSSTVRLSNLSRPASVSVILEESEKGTAPTHKDVTKGMYANYLPLPERETSGSVIPNQNSYPNSRPPSISTFQPFLTSLSTMASINDTIPSEGFSATKPFSDSYSSGDPFRFNYLGRSERSESPTLSTKKARRRGHDFSVDLTQARDNALLEAPTLTFPSDKPLTHSKFAPVKFSTSDACHEPPATTAFTSHVHEPSSPPAPEANGSITASISLLRRMNSEVSAYSTASASSDHSKESPTIPILRGGGINPTEKGNHGTSKYLDVGLKTPIPKAVRGRKRDTLLADKGRDYHQILEFHDAPETFDALGLKISTLEHSSSLTLSPLKPQIMAYTSSPVDRISEIPCREAAQLRPAGSSSTQARVTEIPEVDESTNEEERKGDRWFDASITPERKGERQGKKLELQRTSPTNSMYDEMGFLKDS